LDGKVTQKIKPPKRWNVHRGASQPESRFGGESPNLWSFQKAGGRPWGTIPDIHIICLPL